MSIINSKAIVKDLVSEALKQPDIKALSTSLHTLLLKKKVRFPLLEYAAKELHANVVLKDQLTLLDLIIAQQEIGGNVIAGMLLQLRLGKHFNQSINKASEYIIAGDQWYVCDIIGERVMGYALLTDPEKTIPVLRTLAKHKDKWLVRSVGVATHYAVKKGLTKSYSEHLFRILLSCSTTTDFHTKKGIGWGTKTVAKFHPDIIALYKNQLNNDPNIKTWFKTKIRIGLSRSFKYATKYNR